MESFSSSAYDCCSKEFVDVAKLYDSLLELLEDMSGNLTSYFDNKSRAGDFIRLTISTVLSLIRDCEESLTHFLAMIPDPKPIEKPLVASQLPGVDDPGVPFIQSNVPRSQVMMVPVMMRQSNNLMSYNQEFAIPRYQPRFPALKSLVKVSRETDERGWESEEKSAEEEVESKPVKRRIGKKKKQAGRGRPRVQKKSIVAPKGPAGKKASKAPTSKTPNKPKPPRSGVALGLRSSEKPRLKMTELKRKASEIYSDSESGNGESVESNEKPEQPASEIAQGEAVKESE